MPVRVVERTYLELRTRAQLRPCAPPDEAVSLLELRPCPVEVFRRLYRAVGEAHYWRDRLALADDELAAHLARPDVRVFLLRANHDEAGFFELLRQGDGSVEIAYFGLTPAAQGRGLGRWLLVRAAEVAWDWGASRVWLHTCTLDSPAALPNYTSRGFRPYRTESYTADLPEGAGA